MHLTKPRRLLVGSLGCVLLAGVCGARAVSEERAWRASAMRTSRWFKFDCGKEQASPFVLTVRLPAVDSLQPKLSQPPLPKPE